MSASSHTLSLLAAIVLAFVWLHIPFLNQFSLQVFAAAMISYVVIKRLGPQVAWQIGPGAMSMELALLTFAILLLVGFTVDTKSLLFALTYIHLFLVVFAAETLTAVITTMAVVLYYYALMTNPELRDYVTLATLPLMLIFFLFSKTQYLTAHHRQRQFEVEETLLASSQFHGDQLKSFLSDFLKPKLEYLTTLLSHPAQNKQAIQGQLTLLQVEIEKVILRINESESQEQQAVASLVTEKTEVVQEISQVELEVTESVIEPQTKV